MIAPASDRKRPKSKMIWSLICGVAYSVRLLFKPGDIFTLLRFGNLLTSSRAFSIFLENVKQDPDAALLISQRYSQMQDHSLETLSQCQTGTLGSAFAQHISRHQLQLYPFAIPKNADDRVYLRERQRETHDVLHAVFGLGIEIHEEAQLNAMILIQSKSPISTLIVAGALLQALFKNPQSLGSLVQSISEGFYWGRQAKNLFAIRWEEYFNSDLSSVHQKIGFHGKRTAVS